MKLKRILRPLGTVLLAALLTGIIAALASCFGPANPPPTEPAATTVAMQTEATATQYREENT